MLSEVKFTFYITRTILDDFNIQIVGQNVNFTFDDDHQDESNLFIVLLFNFPFQQMYL